ncbi:MAG: PQQ-binding-like beta-propeller repeat protein [Phycisphaerae bacterium]
MLLLTLALAAPLRAEPLSRAKTGDWPMWGGSPDRNMVSGHRNIPATWNIKTKKNIKWIAPLGSQTYGNPVIVDGRIFVGTNNNGKLRPGITGDKGVMVCLDEKTGKLLWQATHDKLPTGRVNDWPEQGICRATGSTTSATVASWSAPMSTAWPTATTDPSRKRSTPIRSTRTSSGRWTCSPIWRPSPTIWRPVRPWVSATSSTWPPPTAWTRVT